MWRDADGEGKFCMESLFILWIPSCDGMTKWLSLPSSTGESRPFLFLSCRIRQGQRDILLHLRFITSVRRDKRDLYFIFSLLLRYLTFGMRRTSLAPFSHPSLFIYTIIRTVCCL